VNKGELATVGAQIQAPQPVPHRAGSRFGRDRLSDLAGWWAAVAGSTTPRRVEQLWSSRVEGFPPAQAEVVIHRFGAPGDVQEAIAWGVRAADQAVDRGTDLVLLSLQDDASWPVLSAQLLGLDPVEAMGWPEGGGLSDRDWIDRVGAIRDGLRGLRPLGEQPEPLLEQVNSPALAAGTGVLLRAAARRTPVLLDGPGAATCALLADRIARAARTWWQASDAAAGPLHDRMLSELRLTPLTRLGLGAEDGTAARIGLGLLETAIARAADRDCAGGSVDE